MIKAVLAKYPSRPYRLFDSDKSFVVYALNGLLEVSLVRLTAIHLSLNRIEFCLQRRAQLSLYRTNRSLAEVSKFVRHLVNNIFVDTLDQLFERSLEPPELCVSPLLVLLQPHEMLVDLVFLRRPELKSGTPKVMKISWKLVSQIGVRNNAPPRRGCSVPLEASCTASRTSPLDVQHSPSYARSPGTLTR
eukprot:SAG31_NODE_910_length_11078_cov_25.691062_2_plen_190_part_00